MKDETSIFGAKPERLDRLVFEALQDSEAEEETAPTASLGAVLERPGGCIDRYKLLRVLGEGGMGVVYLAEQEQPIKRTVALKVIKPGMDSARVVTRFEAERQALALLDHPNIAHVYDAGTTDSGRPYFVMEYVEGLPITEHCDHHKLTIDDRLKLFLHLCDAVNHAHQKGIIHRDIKPSNILISIQDDQVIPKIIDFGVAKAISQPLTERTLVTEQGRLFGTPEYMSPEQADMAGEDIDTRSDIYSLGVLLYVLLTGVLPFDSKELREGGVEKIRQVIREADPKTPSTRLTKLGEEAKKVAEKRRTQVAILTRRLRKELEWIPLKAMRKERSQRYRSATELADDIENYLKDAPLIAGPPSTIYRAKKFVRRHKAMVTGIATVLIVLIGGIIVSTVFAIRAEHNRSEAQAFADFLNNVLFSVNYSSAQESDFAYILDKATANLESQVNEGKYKDQPLVEASIRAALGWKYRNIYRYEPARELLKRAYQIYLEELGQEDPATLECMARLAWLLPKKESLSMRLKRYEISKRLKGKKDPSTIGAMNDLALSYKSNGQIDKAQLLFLEAINISSRVLGEKHEYTLFIMGNLGSFNRSQGQYKEAEKWLLRLLECRKGVWPDDDIWTLFYTSELASVYREQGRYDEAAQKYVPTLKAQRQVWGDDHPYTLLSINRLGKLYTRLERYEEAELLLLEPATYKFEKLDPQHPHTIDSIRNLIELYEAWNKPEKAEQWQAKLPPK